MKHIIQNSDWKWSENPFPAYRCEVVFGRNKRDRTFLASKVVPDDTDILPENKFNIIKTAAKGTLLVVPGNDTTSRALVMLGREGGFRGGVDLIADKTTAKILNTCQAANACNSRIEVLAIMEVGQVITFYVTGRYGSFIHTYTLNNDLELVHNDFAQDEYQALQDNQEQGEVL